MIKLHSILNTSDNNKCFQTIVTAIDDSINSKDFKAILQSIQSTFKNYLSEINSVFQILGKDLAESKDIKLPYIFDAAFPENKVALVDINEKIELIKQNLILKFKPNFNR